MKENDFEILKEKDNLINFIYNKEEYCLRKTDYNESEYSYYITKNNDIDRICSLFNYYKNDNYYFMYLANKKEFNLDFFTTI